ncbi:aminotransferase class I/II-fold pyridoxal phosphate-dependent enzyme [Treponema sp. HNW]|uniref:aminotransferase class I/II-fold pyridoxal phosphate-dependent enzyme n=1 Tax=Treponema sp. HNW TaxID=3116654 RepID=UPI003D10F60D
MDRIEDIITDDDFSFPSMERPVSMPLFQNSLFCFNSTDDLQKAIGNEFCSHLYSRGNNPTVEQVEKRIAMAEKGERAKLFASGVAAISAAVLSQVKSGDHIICSDCAYSWTKYMCSVYLQRFNVSVTFVNTRDIDAVKKAVCKNTKVLYIESPGSLFMSVSDIKALVEICKNNSIFSIIDNTWATPVFQNPLTLGMDAVVHSASKYLGGHSDIVGGCVISNTKTIEHIFKTEFLPTGAVPDPFQAWLIQRGMRTLKIRLDYHHKAALAVCDYLYTKNEVEKIYYPMHPKSPDYNLASSQMSGGCGLLSIKLKTGDEEKIKKAVDGLKMFRIGVSWGGYESLVLPLLATNGDPSLLRLHIGLENTDSLIEDLDKALFLLK